MVLPTNKSRTDLSFRESSSTRNGGGEASSFFDKKANDEQIEDVNGGSSSNDIPMKDLNDKGFDEQVEDVNAERVALGKNKLVGKLHPDGRRELQESDCYDKLGFSFSWQKKWIILVVTFIVQLSMNFNTSVYPSAMSLIAEKYSISEQAARTSQMIFLIAYAFGCELWAPWSEEYGRWPIMQLSLFFVNVWQVLGGCAPNFGAIMAARFLGGLSSAGGSVTLGITADLYEPNDQGYAVAFIVYVYNYSFLFKMS